MIVDLGSAKIMRSWRLDAVSAPKVEPSAVLFEPRTRWGARATPGFAGLSDSTEAAKAIADIQNRSPT